MIVQGGVCGGIFISQMLMNALQTMEGVVRSAMITH